MQFLKLYDHAVFRYIDLVVVYLLLPESDPSNVHTILTRTRSIVSYRQSVNDFPRLIHDQSSNYLY